MPALSVIVRVPVAVPLDGAVNLTVIVQLALPARLEPQLLDSLKLVDPDVTAMLVMGTAELPPLASVTAWDVLEGENERLVGEAETLVPVPLRLTDCGLPLALSVMVSVPVTGPPAVGVKVTLIVQFDPAATLVPQLLVSEKLLGEIENPEKLSVALPESVTVID